MKFLTFKKVVDRQFTKMLATGKVFTVAVSKDNMKAHYQDSFPPGTNPIFRERAEHDCNCCNTYIGIAGNAVAFIDGKLETVWDVTLEDPTYQTVADSMAALIRSVSIDSVFMHFEENVGIDKNKDNRSDVIWNHFFTKLPEAFVKPLADHASLKGAARTNYEVFNRSVTELSDYAIETVLELIDSKSLYKGGEYEARVRMLQTLKADRESVTNKTQFDWEKSVELGIGSGFRSGPIGNLLVELSKGVELEAAVNAYHAMTAPENYKHSKKPTTKKMTDQAVKRIVELGLEDSLERRHAVTEDITINDVLFADRSVTVSLGGVLGKLKPTAATKEVKTDSAVDITIDEFLSTVVPKASSMELLVTGEHQANFMSLVAPLNDGCLPITEWNNNFSWSYNGELADSSMRKAVAAAGGRTDGVFRFTHSWNHEGNNQSLMDLHVFLPGHGSYKGGTNDNYGNDQRVGWNHRNHRGTQGVQDVDFTSPPGKSIPLENITFPELSKLPEGKYTCAIHNWSSRQNPQSGFKAEIECSGQLFQYEYKPAMANKEWVTVAEATLKDGVFSVEHKIPTSAETSAEVYGIKSKEFHKVTMLMASPNYWDCVEKPTGNKHWFFILENCLNPEPVRGLFNEHLLKELQPDRKVFEVLGNDLKAPYSENQLSGLGFSISQTNSVVVRVRGEVNRLFNIQFNK